jgi:hypothetical protein
MSPPDLSSAPAIGAPQARAIVPAPRAVPVPLWLALASLPWALLWLLPPLNHDVAALLEFTGQWLTGERLYVDLVDVNPPLVFLLYALPTSMARWLGIPVAQVFVLLLLAFVAAVAAAVWRRMAGLGATATLAVAALAPFAVFGLGAGMAGQREQLLLLAALPWMMDAAGRAEGRAPPARGVPAALLAALGLCLKPHFAAMAVLIEAWLLVRRGPAALRDPVPWCFAAVFAAYAGATVLFFPAYLSETLPLVLKAYASFGEMGALDVLLDRAFAPALLVLAACLPSAIRSWRPLRVVLALGAIGAVIGAVAQAKGWPYHRLPAEMLTLLLVGLLAADWLDSLGPAAAASAARLAAALLVAGNAYAFTTREGPWRTWSHANGPVPELAETLRRQAREQPVLALSPGVDPLYPALIQAGSHQAMRYMTLWPVQVAYERCPADGVRYRTVAAMPAWERRVFDDIVADFLRRRPPVVLVDRFTDIAPCSGQEFDFLAYFMRHPAFAEAFAAYRQTGMIDRFAIFTRGR